ncbi:MAG: hypothetical protein IPP15_16980 [Saprospiraceae bacterium]|uniref:Uncharacterized protein n=1 Tax=Candidatus Opimibacter skivensis TaxID=2982028 RepID=A0A9D7SYJ4_9BACT|nr:hypothetical protein [Candidatus Opimibacter skivensis]
MDFLTPAMLHWRRIFVIMLFMISISILTSKFSTFTTDQTIQKSIRDIASKCPIHYENGITMDSIKLMPSRELTFYVTDTKDILTIHEKDRMEESFRQAYGKIIKDDALDYFRKNGFVFVYYFLNTEGNLIFSFRLNGHNDKLKMM